MLESEKFIVVFGNGESWEPLTDSIVFAMAGDKSMAALKAGEKPREVMAREDTDLVGVPLAQFMNRLDVEIRPSKTPIVSALLAYSALLNSCGVEIESLSYRDVPHKGHMNRGYFALLRLKDGSHKLSVGRDAGQTLMRVAQWIELGGPAGDHNADGILTHVPEDVLAHKDRGAKPDPLEVPT